MLQFVKWIVAATFTEAIDKATAELGHTNFKLEQDSDVLDTWFSSALLPFAALGWPTQVTFDVYLINTLQAVLIY